MGEGKTTTDYNIRVETAPTSLEATGKVISDGLLVIMTLKGLPSNYKTFCTEVMKRENDRCSSKDRENGGNTDGIMPAKVPGKKPQMWTKRAKKCGLLFKQSQRECC